MTTRLAKVLHDGRKAERLSVACTASLREHGWARFDVDLIDLSLTGFRCRTSFTLRPKTRVWLTIPTFAPLEAEVAWAQHFNYGCRLVNRLHPAVLGHIVARHGLREQ